MAFHHNLTQILSLLKCVNSPDLKKQQKKLLRYIIYPSFFNSQCLNTQNNCLGKAAIKKTIKSKTEENTSQNLIKVDNAASSYKK